MKITKEQLIEYGFENSLDPIIPLRKIIGEGEEGELMLVVTHERNITELALSMPDGAILYLRPASIEHLKMFESCIESWSPVY